MDVMKTGALIRQRRTALGITQRELAEKLQVSVTAVSKWENGHSLPDISLMEPLSRILGIPISDLIAGERSQSEMKEAEQKSEEQEAVLKESVQQRRRKVRRAILIAVAACLAAVAAGFLLWNYVLYTWFNGSAEYSLHVEGSELQADIVPADANVAVRSARVYEKNGTVYLDVRSVQKGIYRASSTHLSFTASGPITQIAVPQDPKDPYSHDLVLWESGMAITPQAREIYDQMNYRHQSDPLGPQEIISLLNDGVGLSHLRVTAAMDEEASSILNIAISGDLDPQDAAVPERLRHVAIAMLAFTPDAEAVNLIYSQGNVPSSLAVTEWDATEYTGRPIHQWASSCAGIQKLLKQLGLNDGGRNSNLLVTAD